MTSRLIAIVVAWLVGLLGVSSPAVAVSLDAPVAACAYNAPASSAEITGSATECGPLTVTYDDTASRVAIHVATDGHWARPLLVSTLTYSAYDHTGQFAQVTGGPGTTRTVLVGREVDTRVVQGTRGAANFGPKSLGAAQRLRYEGAPYHGATNRGLKNAAPANGQEALDFSTQIKPTSPRRIGVDPNANEFVIFDQTVEGVFHGHVRSWSELTGGMQSVLRKAGMVDRRGNIL